MPLSLTLYTDDQQKCVVTVLIRVCSLSVFGLESKTISKRAARRLIVLRHKQISEVNYGKLVIFGGALKCHPLAKGLTQQR